MKNFAKSYYTWDNNKETIEKRTASINEYLTKELQDLNVDTIRTDIPVSYTHLLEELRVLIEATIPKNGEFPSAWFDLPIDETEFEELLGVEADSEDYRIVEMELPFADDVSEATTVDTLNDLYRMYENLPAEIREELPAFMAYYSNLDELHNYRHDIIHYANCNSMTDVARHVLADDPARCV